MSFIANIQKMLRGNIREYGMYIALFVIMLGFSITTEGVFISPRNLVNLVNQTAYIAVLAVGMTLVIVIRHIDLSVGYLAGFLGAVAAIAMVSWQLPTVGAIAVVLALGIVAGLISGFLVAQLEIPAFVATLAGWLGYRGALQLVTRATGTIIIPNEDFNAIGNLFIPDIPGLTLVPGFHSLTLLIGILGIALFLVGELRGRSKLRSSGAERLPTDVFVFKLVLVIALVGGLTRLLASYQGLSWTVVVILIVMAIYQFITTRTVLGRHIYAVGGNPEAAELSGINVKRVTYVVFGSMGMLSGLSGILFASRLRSATTTAGQLFELDAIAAAFVGGVSSGGGVGNVIGSLIGAFVMTSLTSGMNLMGMDISYQYIVRASVLALAVIFDVATRKRE